MSALVTVMDYNGYAPVLPIDYESPLGEVNMRGLHSQYNNDLCLERVRRSGFSRLSATSYRLEEFADVGNGRSSVSERVHNL